MAQKRAVVRQSLPDVIVADLRKRILSGNLVEGELIRQELLADEYDVSRMPIREALKRLDAEGLVVFQNNRGATVTKHTLEEIAEIFDVRMLLEVDLFRRSIPNMTEQDFAECEEILDAMHTSYASGQVAEWGPLNEEYHSKLYEASGRELTKALLERVSLQSNRYVGMHIDELNKSDNAEKDHQALLDLARKGQVDEAAEKLRSHIENTKLQMLELIAAKRATEDAP
ncbi:GntR family transcriptional regulator [Oceanospirillum linum]|uniref:GntR family transcriptional regulator n=1 Tax=Oceanospirillum linum TaxID=966 RepID=A0A1T1HCX2_OCELI|nr:GntR family transcriptional regulator [Oceanospirillum linum]OOV87701.1 GntR family transcriptional regulator [Oceanospirillum linum]SEG15160.1 DNA-binding transcriptional regulator, GntR family [Oleiphilus messinensis]SMP11056.1 transcriptional regulator, GntR family [Oceanospirillum linum]